jgi:choline dehydrogenase-like flavoprotein
MVTRQYDLDDDSVVVVIGSGAGGGTLSNELAQKGIDVVCLEAGDRLTLNDIVNEPTTMHGKLTWLDKRLGAPVGLLCKTVGGTTMRWTAVALRIQEHEFKPLSTYGKLDGTTLIDWPLTLEELAPYYDKAEDKMGVTGTHGIPPSFETSNYKVLKAGGKRVGYKEITSERTAINPVARDGRPGCIQLGFCVSGCAVGAKWSTLYTEIPKAEQTDHFELRTQAMVLKINHDKSGKITGVVYVDAEGKHHEQKARAVCVAGNVVETTRLLHNSASNLFPDGLGNSSGHLGRNYMRHMTHISLAIMPKPVNFHRGTRISGLIMDERYHKPERGFAGGYYIETGAGDPFSVSLWIDGWGEEVADYMENYAKLAGVFASGEDPPQASNRIRFHDTEKDAYGLQVPILEYERHPNTDAMRNHSISMTRDIYESLGSRKFIATDSGAGCHNMGVARMSADPKDGVTNRWGRAHDIPNLFISDGSVFSSSAAANPTLTIVALAIRQSDHIAGLMARREL